MMWAVIVVGLLALFILRRRRKARQGRAAGALSDALGRRPVPFEQAVYYHSRRPKDWR